MFWATIGGMGLTGVILEATFSLIPISSSLISVDTTRFQDLEALMGAMVEAATLSSEGFQAVGGDVSPHLLAIGGVAAGARPAGSPGGARF